MFSIDDLKKTRYAQELIAETETLYKQKVIVRLSEKGFSMEEIADILELDISQVREVIANLS